MNFLVTSYQLLYIYFCFITYKIIFFQTTKEEFDYEARNIMTEDQVRLHNEFLLCLFNKVRGLAAATPTCKIDRDKNLKERRLLKRKYKTDKSNFEVYKYLYI